jgi:hypothetical protein
MRCSSSEREGVMRMPAHQRPGELIERNPDPAEFGEKAADNAYSGPLTIAGERLDVESPAVWTRAELERPRRARRRGLRGSGVADSFDALTDDALLGYLTGAAVEREERLVIEERDDEWFAETRSASGFGGEAVILGVNGPDRRTAMLRLAHLLAEQ